MRHQRRTRRTALIATACLLAAVFTATVSGQAGAAQASYDLQCTLGAVYSNDPDAVPAAVQEIQDLINVLMLPPIVVTMQVNLELADAQQQQQGFVTVGDDFSAAPASVSEVQWLLTGNDDDDALLIILAGFVDTMAIHGDVPVSVDLAGSATGPAQVGLAIDDTPVPANAGYDNQDPPQAIPTDVVVPIVGGAGPWTATAQGTVTYSLTQGQNGIEAVIPSDLDGNEDEDPDNTLQSLHAPLTCTPLSTPEFLTVQVIEPVEPGTIGAVNDGATTEFDTPVTVDVLANDQANAVTIDPSTLSITADPSNGASQVVDQQIEYTPDAGFAGADLLTYEICGTDDETTEEVCDTATLTITVNAAPTTVPTTAPPATAPPTTVAAPVTPGGAAQPVAGSPQLTG